jgi:predicted 2-oxoglutarate/Fe(II)-dependent dioxygenase YbiX
MQIVIGNVLSAEEINTVTAALARATFVDGKATAGFAARPVKNNRQAEGSDRSLEMVRKLIAARILGNEIFRLAVRPKALSELLFSHYEAGMHYGRHVDDAPTSRSRCFSRTPRATAAASSRSRARRGTRRSSSIPARWSPIPRRRCTA